MALHAAKLIWDNLAESVNGEPGEDKIKAQEKMHNAATMAGMAFGSAFLGMCHGMAHTIGALCHVAHGRTNSILLPYVIRYNGSIPEDRPAGRSTTSTSLRNVTRRSPRTLA